MKHLRPSKYNATNVKNFLLIFVFCAFIFAFFVLFIVLPKQKESELEKKELSTFPSATLSNVLNGEFGKNFETYVADHFPARQFFVGVNAEYELYTGRNGLSGVYKGKDGYLINTPVTPNNENMLNSINRINLFAETNASVPVDMMVVPSTGYLYEEELPSNHRVYRDDVILKDVQDNLSDRIQYIDLLEPFSSLSESEQLFYKTDHHWTSQGAYEAYRVYCAQLGITPLAKEEFSITSTDGFYGTTYSRAALWAQDSDTIEVWAPPTDGNVTVEINDGAETKQSNSYFFPSHLEELDKYPVFLDGNHSYVKITNPQAQGGKLLLVKDSFGHCLAPFLSQHYSEIIMVDLRYYKQSLSQLIETEGIDRVLILYGLDNMVNDTNIVFIK